MARPRKLPELPPPNPDSLAFGDVVTFWTRRAVDMEKPRIHSGVVPLGRGPLVVLSQRDGRTFKHNPLDLHLRTVSRKGRLVARALFVERRDEDYLGLRA